MVGHLLSYEFHCVIVRLCLAIRVFRQSSLLRGAVNRGVGASIGGHVALGHPPGAVEGLPDDGVVGFLGNGSLAALVEGGEVILHKADHPLLGAAAARDGDEEVGVRHEVRVHLQQRPLLQNEGGKNHLKRKAIRP